MWRRQVFFSFRAVGKNLEETRMTHVKNRTSQDIPSFSFQRPSEFRPTVRFIWLRICMWPVIFVIPCVEFSPCAKLWQSMTSAHGWILRYPWSRKDCTGSVGRKLQFKPFTSYKMILNDYRMVINGFVMVCYYSMFMFFLNGVFTDL